MLTIWLIGIAYLVDSGPVFQEGKVYSFPLLFWAAFLVAPRKRQPVIIS